MTEVNTTSDPLPSSLCCIAPGCKRLRKYRGLCLGCYEPPPGDQRGKDDLGGGRGLGPAAAGRPRGTEAVGSMAVRAGGG